MNHFIIIIIFSVADYWFSAFWFNLNILTLIYAIEFLFLYIDPKFKLFFNKLDLKLTIFIINFIFRLFKEYQ